jgi:hypothetical protein
VTATEKLAACLASLPDPKLAAAWDHSDDMLDTDNRATALVMREHIERECDNRFGPGFFDAWCDTRGEIPIGDAMATFRKTGTVV